MGKLDVSVIILTGNEEIHICRCLERVCDIAKEVFVIDSFSTDHTVEYAQRYDNVHILKHVWENNHAKQFNWGLANADIKTKWVLKLDADEYLSDELKEELRRKLPLLEDRYTGVVIPLLRFFMGKPIKKGGMWGIKMLRLFQYGRAKSEVRLMDEHLELLEGECIEFDNPFVDDNLNNLSWWTQKHVGYAIREAADLLDIEYNLSGSAAHTAVPKINAQALAKRKKKETYAKLPLFFRAFVYFCYRYFLKLGFMEGKEGFLWHFLQGWWYRTLVDAKIYEIKKTCGNDRKKIVEHLREVYQIEI